MNTVIAKYSLVDRILKRGIDIAVSSTSLLLSAPLIITMGALVKIDSAGPVFYRSHRVGRNWKDFDLLKLRTMVHGDPGKSIHVTAANDTRITKIGRMLRRTKIDEIPQFWNVLIGDVSLVGPRPEVRKYALEYQKEYTEILKIRPGLSDWATLAFIDEEAVLAGEKDAERAYIDKILPQKILLYLDYVRNPSAIEDIRIITKTASRVVRRTISQVFERLVRK